MTIGAEDRQAPGGLGLRLATSLGVGLAPGPRGTYASLLTTALAWAWLALGGAPLAGWWYGLVVAGVTVLSVAAADAAVKARLFGDGHDPGQIVIDEAAGQLIALYGITAPGLDMVAALAAFRLFDILKPWPVGASQRLPGGWGVTADDVLAGLYALAALKLTGAWLG